MGMRAPQPRDAPAIWGDFMRKHLLGLAMAVATFGLVAQGGTANAFLLNDRSPNVTAGQIVAGGGTAAVYWAQIFRHNFLRCALLDRPRGLKWYGITTVGCPAVRPT